MFAGRRMLKAVARQQMQQRAAATYANAGAAASGLDSDDIFELATCAFKANAGSHAGGAAADELAAVLPQLSGLKPVQAAQLAAGSWPRNWGVDGEKGQAMATLRELIHDATPGLDGAEAAIVFCILCGRGASGAFWTHLHHHEQTLISQAMKSGKHVTTRPGTYGRAFIHRLLKVIIYHINDVKKTELLLNLCATAKRLNSSAGAKSLDLPDGFWDLMCRRLTAHDRMYKLTAEQGYRAFCALSDRIGNKQLLLPFVHAVIRGTTTSFMKAKDAGEDTNAPADFVSRLKKKVSATETAATGTTTPFELNEELTAWARAADRLEYHSTLTPNQWMNVLLEVGTKYTREQFRMFYPIMKELILPMVAESNGRFMNEFIRVLRSANVRNEMVLSTVMRRAVELDRLRFNNNSIHTGSDGLSTISFRSMRDILDLLSVSPHVIRDSPELPTFLSLVLDHIERFIDDIHPHDMSQVAQLLYRVCRPVLDLEKKTKSANATKNADDMEKLSIADDLKVERGRSLIINPVMDCVSQVIAGRFLRLFKRELLSLKEVERFLDVALLLQCREEPIVAELLKQFRSAHDQIMENRKRLEQNLPKLDATHDRVPRGTRELFHDLHSYCLQMNLQGRHLRKGSQAALEKRLNVYRTQDVLGAIHLRVELASPPSASKYRVSRPIPPMLASFCVTRVFRDASDIAASIGKKYFSWRRAAAFLESVSLVRGECEEIARRLDESASFVGLYEHLAEMDAKGLLRHKDNKAAEGSPSQQNSSPETAAEPSTPTPQAEGEAQPTPAAEAA